MSSPSSRFASIGIARSEWTTGSWASVARMVAGPWLEIGMIVGGMLGALGMLNALIMSYSANSTGPGRGRISARDPRTTRPQDRGAPTVSILVCAIAWGLALNLGFERLIELDLLFYGLSLVLEFVALVVLRVREPGLRRPYRVPGGIAGATLVGVAPTCLDPARLDSKREQRRWSHQRSGLRPDPGAPRVFLFAGISLLVPR